MTTTTQPKASMHVLKTSADPLVSQGARRATEETSGSAAPTTQPGADTEVVPIVGLNYKDGRDDAIGWLRKHGDPYTTSVMDADGRVGIDYGVYGVPETFLIDQAGMIRYKHIGPVTPEAVRDLILPKIAELKRAG